MGLYDEISTLLEKTHRFEQLYEDNIRDGSPFLVKYRISPIDILRRANAQSRKYLFEDLRDGEDLAFDQISFLVALARSFACRHFRDNPPIPRYGGLDYAGNS